MRIVAGAPEVVLGGDAPTLTDGAPVHPPMLIATIIEAATHIPNRRNNITLPSCTRCGPAKLADPGAMSHRHRHDSDYARWWSEKRPVLAFARWICRGSRRRPRLRRRAGDVPGSMNAPIVSAHWRTGVSEPQH